MRRDPGTAFVIHQSGAALLIFMLIVVVAALSLMLNRLASRTNTTGRQSTAQALAQAKDAIVGWSASHSTKPGMLPCPEDITLIGNPNNEGQAQSTCSNTSPSVGRLPWRTLRIPRLLDDVGEPLWYALSPGFRGPSKINGSSLGQLAIDGSPNSVVAIIFSPGPPLSGQNRAIPTATVPPDIMNYLEGYDLTGTGSFVSFGVPDLFNDRLVTVTRHELFRAVDRRILSELRGDEASGLIKYYADNNAFPPEGTDLSSIIPSTVTPSFMLKNDWYSLLTYSVSADLQQATLTINAPVTMTCTVKLGQTACQ